MEEFSEEEIVTQQLVIVLSATHGEGDPPDNAMRFHKWIKTKVKEKSNALEKMKFSCFGLGNTQYENYNAMGGFSIKAFLTLVLSCSTSMERVTMTWLSRRTLSNGRKTLEGSS